jgi:hypothetical protein
LRIRDLEVEVFNTFAQLLLLYNGPFQVADGNVGAIKINRGEVLGGLEFVVDAHSMGLLKNQSLEASRENQK